MYHRGKKKIAQAAKETKDQLSALQAKLESANNGIWYKRIFFRRLSFSFVIEMINKDNRIETLEKENETMSREIKMKQDYLVKTNERYNFIWKYFVFF